MEKSVSNVSKLPGPPKRCEFPNCPVHDKTVGLVKIFNKHMCPQHRKIMLLAKSFLDQIEDQRKQADLELDIMGRLQKLASKSERVFVLDKPLMDDLKGLLTDQQARIKELENDRAAVASTQKSPEAPTT